MWVFIFLYTLGINICQVAAEGESTQMHYARLTIDKSVFDFINNRLSHFSANMSNLQIKDLKMTTNCTKEGELKLSCSCMSDHKWSDEQCKSDPSCCQGTCSLPRDTTSMCVSNSIVGVTGNVTLKGKDYQTCLTNKDSNVFKECDSKLLQEMKKVYSTLYGFDSLEIKSYSVGSVIANFDMTIVSNVKSQDLIDRSIKLISNLNGSMTLETSGIVIISVPREPVNYTGSAVLSCTPREDLGNDPRWSLNRQNEEFNITNGTISTVINNDHTKSTVALNRVNELWEGEYTCIYVQINGSMTVNHKANASMDICLQPTINAYTEPAFPLCGDKESVLVVTLKCEIDKSTENYKVEWSEYTTAGKNTSDTRKQTYDSQKVISCDPDGKGAATMALASCNFTNKCNQQTTKSFTFNIIYAGDQYCIAEGEWDVTKVGFDAKLKCTNQAGLRKRKCNAGPSGTRYGIWGNEVSECVNQQLQDVLKRAIISDTGLGELNVNAAEVFSRFENITKTAKLDTSANIKTSVEVFYTLKDKLNSINKFSVIDDFLDSSSHLLNETLEKSWKTAENLTADKYLVSLERLIEISDTTETIKKLNLELVTCNASFCTNTVFENTVQISSSSKVRTAGFKFLQNYLPNNNNSEEPNSIVVSTTTEEKLENIEVIIDFVLLKPRPRNVKLKCVFWDNSSKSWSSDSCRWAGSVKEGRCICNHLSSFAILMSKEPQYVPELEQLTHVALGISIVSLVLCLVTEMIVWSDVVKTNTLYLRHTAHINISLCLLVADICFLASSNPKDLTDIWCKTSVVLKHFCYLAMFFWMLCLSCTLLHQAVFLFHKVSKTNYLRFSLVLGYSCPLIIVFVTFLTNSAGAEDVYYSRETCWLIYSGSLKGSIFTFIIPVGIIVFINVFSMFVVMMKLLSHHQTADVSQEKEKAAAKTVLRSVILLTPIFGVTWVFGFAVMIFDITDGAVALAVNYIFVLLNAFQGLFIFLTSCLGDKMTREALMKHLRKKAPVSSMSESTTKFDSSVRK